MKHSIRFVMFFCIFIYLLSVPVYAEKMNDYKVTGPFTSGNLDIYLFKSNNVKPIDYLTLEEALDQQLVTLFETSDVNNLSIENNSKKHSVYVQAGDIVKGGKQDRVIAVDLVLPPKSGKVKLGAFCVEHDRWNKRNNEDSKKFSSSKNVLNTKKLKLAAKVRKSQGEVWKEVENTQNKMGDKIGKSVKSNDSQSSLQLTLEDKDVKKRTQKSINEIMSQIKIDQKTCGFAFAVNGELNSADIYGSTVLFKKLFPKLLEAASSEAFTESKDNSKHTRISPESISSKIKAQYSGKKKTEKKNNVQQIRYETDEFFLFETYHIIDNKTELLHLNLISKL